MRRALSIFVGLLASAAFGGFVFSSSAHAKRQRAPAIAETVRPISLASLPPAEGWFSLLDEQGRLEKPVAPSTLALWQREAHLSGNNARLAQVHVWLGEYAMDATEDVEAAQWHWKQAQKIVGRDSALGELARYDAAVLEYFRGANSDAVNRFKALLSDASPKGFDRLTAAVWYRHARIAEGYHAQHEALGIPEPPAPDPLCVASGFSVCLQTLGLQHDRRFVLNEIRHTGFGSSTSDIVEAANKLRLDAIELQANDKGLDALPKPLIAHVEHDHFVTVTKASAAGVTYLCSDCGAWPGGDVHLTWNQWHALDADALFSIQRRHSELSDAIHAAASKEGDPAAAICRAQTYSSEMTRLIAALKSNVFLTYVSNISNNGNCGNIGMPGGQFAAPGQKGAADCPGSGQAGAGTCGDPVNLATGQEEYSPPPDIEVYNPIGPSVAFSRMYASMRGEKANQNLQTTQSAAYFGYNYHDFGGYGTWSQSYDMDIYDGNVSHGSNNLPAGEVAQASTGTANLTGTFPTSGDTWEVDDPNGNSLGTTSAPNNWVVNAVQGQSGNTVTVYAPRTAAVQTDTVKYSNGAAASIQVVAENDTFAATAKYLLMPNGSLISFTPQGVPAAGQPPVTCTVPSGTPMSIQWLYDASDEGGDYIVTFKDGSQWFFQATDFYSNASWLNYIPKKIYDSVGNYIQLKYAWSNGSSFLKPMLSAVTDDASPTPNNLLTVTRNADGSISAINDCYKRSIYYGYSNFPKGNYNLPELNTVSQLVKTGAGSPSMRYTYGYSQPPATPPGSAPDYLVLSSIQVPNPTGSQTPATTTINYDTAGFVTSVVDANNNTTSYSALTGNETEVTVTDNSNNIVKQYIVDFDNSMNQLDLKDGSGNTIWSKSYGSSADPYMPSTFTDPSLEYSTQFIWDGYGNLDKVTTPRGQVITYTWTAPSGGNFPMGRLTQIKMGTKTPTSYTYYEPSGLLATLTTPIPGTVGGGTQTTSFQYTALGNLSQVTSPGNGSVGAHVTTFNYTNDTTYHYTTPEMLGKPVMVMTTSGDATHYQYDGNCNLSRYIDGSGNEHDFAYDDEFDLKKCTNPATGQTGTGNSYECIDYLYPQGPVVDTELFDEGDHIGTPVETALYTYGPEGELLSKTGNTLSQSYAYDGAYRLKSLSDGNSHSTNYSYDSRGNLTAITYADGKTISFPLHDAAGRVTKRVDANSVVTTYTYDTTHDGNLRTISYPATPSLNVSLVTDGYDRLYSVTDGSGSRGYTYDDLDEPLTENTTYGSLPQVTNTYTYNPDCSLASMAVSQSGGFNLGFSYSYL